MAVGKDHLLGVRVGADLLRELDDEVGRIRLERPGCTFSRSDCVRELLWQMLKQRRRLAGAAPALPTEPGGGAK
ncbi:MAG TPA: hypothetical protein VE987_19485 [Polyangiaceae bacterium]|nr:hypothetical protein [Polyangiaceae bacterium]